MKTIEMTYKKSTKGTHVFENQEQDTAITVLYIKKTAMDVPPLLIRVTIDTQWEIKSGK